MDSVVLATVETHEALQSMLDKAKISAKKDRDDFLSTPGPHVGGAIGVYSKLLRSMSLESREELMWFWSKNGQNRKLTEAVEKLWEVEDDWDTFLEELDKETLREGGDPAKELLSVGSEAPGHVELFNVRDQQNTSLQGLIDHLDPNDEDRLHLILLRHFA